MPGQLDGRRKKIGAHQYFLLEKIPPHFCPSGICLKCSNESTSYIWPRHFSSSFSMWWLEISELVHEPFRSGILVFPSSSALPSGSPAGSQARCQWGLSSWWRSSVLRSRVWGSNTLLCRGNLHSCDIPPTPHIVAIGWEETMSLPLPPSEWVLFFIALLTCVQSLSYVWLYRLQPSRLLYPLSLGVCSCPLSHWCSLTISFAAAPFFFCLQSFPASASSPVSWLFASGGQSINFSSQWIFRADFH